MTTIIDSTYQAMDASKQVNLSMIEIKEIVYQLNKSIENMKKDSSRQIVDESGIHNEKKVLLEQIIQKLQS